ncbi:MAG: hypothetical protein EUB_01663 [Eubacterium sp.]
MRRIALLMGFLLMPTGVFAQDAAISEKVVPENLTEPKAVFTEESPEITLSLTPEKISEGVNAPSQVSQDTDTSAEQGETAIGQTVLNSDNVTLYAIDEWAQKYLSIPTEYPQSFQIKINGEDSKIKWYSEDDEVAFVDDRGVVNPGQTAWHYTDGTIHNEYNFNQTIELYGYYNDQKLSIQVTVKDYGEIYTNDVINQYLKDNINPSMSTYEKVEEICKFVASYDYSANYSSMESMIVSGEGGDCWASTQTVNTMCEILKIPAEIRYRANQDPGAGSGHMNSYVLIDGDAYIVDVGYYAHAPRYYLISQVTEPFIYKEKPDGTLTITGYDGFYEKVEIPEQIDGKIVTKLGDSSFYGHNEINEVILPDSIKTIGNWAFASSESIEKINLGAVQSIGDRAFYCCSALNFVELPDSVIHLGISAFDLCETLEKVTLSKNLKVLPVRAFAQTNIKEVVIPEGITTIEAAAFWSLTLIELPESVQKLDVCLTECKVLYHGNQEQWEKIEMDSAQKPKAENIFYTSYGVILTEKSLGLQIGETYGLTAWTADKSIKWISSNKEVVTVSADGQVTAVSDGSAIVKAQVSNGAAEIKINVVKSRGDVNDDGMINASDALLDLRHSVKEIILQGNSFVCADVTKDNVINASDGLQILRYAVKEISNFE